MVDLSRGSIDNTASTPPEPGTERQLRTADLAYNDRLTALDHAIQRLRDFPAPPDPFDASQLAKMNERWQLLAHSPFTGGRWLGRFRALVWDMLRPLWARQERFNATVVEHLNRNAESQRQTSAAIADLLVLVREELAGLVAFESKLVQYAQTITAYVDTKDRSVDSLPPEVRTALNVMNHAIQTLKRELERAGAAVSGTPPSNAPMSGVAALNSYKYVGFADHFRGAEAEIRERLRAYAPVFTGCADVVDIGCGRGEFLALLGEQGISAHGVDVNDEMVGICRARGLEAARGDALTWLDAQPDTSIGGLFASQVIEHLEPEYLLRLLDAAYHKLRPGSPIVLETINPACWYAFFSSYIRDITHVRPIHPDTLRYLLVASGFLAVEIRYAVPVPETVRLQPIAIRDGSTITTEVAAINENIAKLNGLMFTHYDYAGIARRT
jgi:O-antigen chain-terminating methyltransferase